MKLGWSFLNGSWYHISICNLSTPPYINRIESSNGCLTYILDITYNLLRGLYVLQCVFFLKSLFYFSIFQKYFGATTNCQNFISFNVWGCLFNRCCWFDSLVIRNNHTLLNSYFCRLFSLNYILAIHLALTHAFYWFFINIWTFFLFIWQYNLPLFTS